MRLSCGKGSHVYNSQMKLDDRFELYYALMREVVEHPRFVGRVSLFQYNDADKLGYALAQLDADRAQE